MSTLSLTTSSIEGSLSLSCTATSSHSKELGFNPCAVFVVIFEYSPVFLVNASKFLKNAFFFVRFQRRLVFRLALMLEKELSCSVFSSAEIVEACTLVSSSKLAGFFLSRVYSSTFLPSASHLPPIFQSFPLENTVFSRPIQTNICFTYRIERME